MLANDSALCRGRTEDLLLHFCRCAWIYSEPSLLESVYKVTNPLWHWQKDAIPCRCDWKLWTLNLLCVNEGQFVACKRWEILLPLHGLESKLSMNCPVKRSLSLLSAVQMLWDGGCSQDAGTTDAIRKKEEGQLCLYPHKGRCATSPPAPQQPPAQPSPLQLRRLNKIMA